MKRKAGRIVLAGWRLRGGGDETMKPSRKEAIKLKQGPNRRRYQ